MISCGAPFGSPATSYEGGPWALRPRLAAGLPLRGRLLPFICVMEGRKVQRGPDGSQGGIHRPVVFIRPIWRITFANLAATFPAYWAIPIRRCPSRRAGTHPRPSFCPYSPSEWKGSSPKFARTGFAAGRAAFACTRVGEPLVYRRSMQRGYAFCSIFPQHPRTRSGH
jgi:hypothetical protein